MQNNLRLGERVISIYMRTLFWGTIFCSILIAIFGKDILILLYALPFGFIVTLFLCLPVLIVLPILLKLVYKKSKNERDRDLNLLFSSCAICLPIILIFIFNFSGIDTEGLSIGFFHEDQLIILPYVISAFYHIIFLNKKWDIKDGITFENQIGFDESILDDEMTIK